MVKLNYDIWYRQRGVFRPNEVMRPRVWKLEDFSLPKSSVFHYFGNGNDDGPPKDLPVLEGNKRIVPIYHITDLVQKEGNPRLLAGQPENWIRRYQAENRWCRRVLDISQGGRDPMTPFLINHCLVDRRYRYIENAYSVRNKWLNKTMTTLDAINRVAASTEFQQFIVLGLPTLLPNISLLRQATRNMNLTVMKQFNNGESFMILEFWKWLSENRADSILSRIDKKYWHKVNFVFMDSGCWFCFNMAKLDGWRIATKEELASDPDSPKKGFNNKKLPVLFINMLNQFLLVRAGGIEQVEALDESLAESGDDEKEAENKEVGISRDKSALDTPTGEVPTTVKVSETKASNNPVEVDVKVDVDKAEPELQIDKETGEFIIEEDIEENISKDFDALEKMTSRVIKADKNNTEGYAILKEDELRSPAERTMEKVTEIADQGMMTAAEYRRFEKLATKYKEIKFPGTDKTIEEMAKITPEELKITEAGKLKDNPTVHDKSMTQSTLKKFNKDYIENVLEKDVAAMLMSVQNAGICITDLEKETIEDIGGKYDRYRLSVQPVNGKASTIWMKVPSVNNDGQWISNGVRYCYRHNKFDLPIRKIAPDKVALTSYFGKITATRSHKKITDYGEWLRNQIMVLGLDEEDITVQNLKPSNTFNSKLVCPRLYSTLSMRFGGFTLGGYDWYLDNKQRVLKFTADEMKEWEKDGSFLVGKSKNGDMLLMDKKSYLYSIKKTGNIWTSHPAPNIETMLGLDRMKAPIDMVALKVLGKQIPIGFILAYRHGLSKLIRSLGVDYRRVPKDSRLDMQETEWRLVFGDESLIFSREDTLASMILAGLKDFHRELKKYSVYDFDRKDVYLNLLESVGLSNRYLREIELMYDMFVDPITHDILVEMNEPTSFNGLLIRTVELLMTDDHPDEIDPAYMRIRGYERIPGAMYTELVRGIRAQSGRAGRSNVPIEINPFAVWRSIVTDPSVMVVNDINPIQNLKHQEEVTFSGTGGRSSVSMVKHTREYHENDLGTVSEATVDSSDVGVNAFLSANPNLATLRGITKRYDPEMDGKTSLMSTSMALAVGADADDMKRANFISIQNSHTVSCNGYHVLPVRTGMESLIAGRTSDMFAKAAPKDGTVTAVHDNSIVVVYKDGTEEHIEIGRRYAAAAGLTIPQDLVTQYKVGNKFKAGDILTYNKGFFELDQYSGEVTYKAGLLATVVEIETPQTNEDSSVITKRLAEKLKTHTSKVRNIVLGFDQGVRDLVKPGDLVESTDPLCLIEEGVLQNNDSIDRASVDILRMLGSQTPLAKTKGKIGRIEVFYHGDYEDMSESLRKLARAADKDLTARNKALGKNITSGKVDEGFRVDGNPLMPYQLVIRIYIDSDIVTDGGDKIVLANQMKSVISKVINEPLKTEDGEEIDMEFGRRSIQARIVNSPDIIGTTTTLLEVIGKKAFEIYNKG